MQVGAARNPGTGVLTLHVEAEIPWSGVLMFDSPRHRTIWNMPINYARLNSALEWFVIEPHGDYDVRDSESGIAPTHRGDMLIKGLPVRLAANQPLRLTVLKQ